MSFTIIALQNNKINIKKPIASRFDNSLNTGKFISIILKLTYFHQTSIMIIIRIFKKCR